MDFFDPAQNPAGFAVAIGAVVLVVVVVALAWRIRWARRLSTGGARGGLQGQATIESMRRGKVRTNGHWRYVFDLLVEVPGQAPYRAEVKQTIPNMVYGRLATGMRVAVVVDPGDPSEVKLDLEATLGLDERAGLVAGFVDSSILVQQVAGAAMGVGGGDEWRQQPEVERNADLLARGIPTWVTVLSAHDNGMWMGPDPMVAIGLHVHAAEGDYKARLSVYRVPAAVRPQVVPGVRLRAAVDPANRQSLALDWASL